MTIEEAKSFAFKNGLVVSKHFTAQANPPKYTMWINNDDPNQTRIVIPVCEEKEFIAATKKIIAKQKAELDARVGKKRYTVGVREVHINHIRVIAENEEEAKSIAIETAEGSLYLEFSHTMAKDLFSVEEIAWDD